MGKLLGQRGTIAVAATLNFVVGGGAIILGCMLRSSGEDADKQARQEAARRVGAFVLQQPRAARLADASPTQGPPRAHRAPRGCRGDRAGLRPGHGAGSATAPSWLALPLVMLVAGLSAALLPVIARLSVAPDRDVGAGIGRLYLADVVGAVAGCLFTGFVLMDHRHTELTSALDRRRCRHRRGAVERCRRMADARRDGRPIRALRRTCVAAVPLYADLCASGSFIAAGVDRRRFDHVVETKGGVAAVTHEGMIYGGGVYDGRVSIDFVDDVNGVFRRFRSAPSFGAATRSDDRPLRWRMGRSRRQPPTARRAGGGRDQSGLLEAHPELSGRCRPVGQSARQDRARRRAPLAAQPSRSRLRCRDHEHDLPLALIRLQRAFGGVPAPGGVGAQSGRRRHVQRDRLLGGASHRGGRVPGRHAPSPI